MKAATINFHGGDEQSGDVFMVETKAKAGYRLTQHVHDHAHLSYLASGKALVDVDGEITELQGPCPFVVAANKLHSVEALTDIVWLCLWDAKHGADQSEALEKLTIPEA